MMLMMVVEIIKKIRMIIMNMNMIMIIIVVIHDDDDDEDGNYDDNGPGFNLNCCFALQSTFLSLWSS